MQDLDSALQALAAAGLARRRHVVDSPCGPRVMVEGREMLAFASNNYLGLANHPAVVAALVDGAQRWGAGSGASHLVSGHLAPHEKLERELAAFVGFPRTLSFSTGYLANLAILPTLAGRGAAIFADKLNHASLIDAVQLCKANGAHTQRYAHADMAALERLLASSNATEKFIVSDAVFSMDGDLAPLPELLTLAGRFDAWLVIDDAHGFGILGPHGEGSLAHFGIAHAPRLILMGTLGKAAGVAGAFVAGTEALIETLLQKGRSYIFTTAPPPAIAVALGKSLELIASGDALRNRINSHIHRLRQGMADLPWRLADSPTAIQPLMIGENQAALALSQALREHGLWIPAIRPPTVPPGSARLRISLSAAHSDADLDQLIATLRQLAST